MVAMQPRSCAPIPASTSVRLRQVVADRGGLRAAARTLGVAPATLERAVDGLPVQRRTLASLTTGLDGRPGPALAPPVEAAVVWSTLALPCVCRTTPQIAKLRDDLRLAWREDGLTDVGRDKLSGKLPASQEELFDLDEKANAAPLIARRAAAMKRYVQAVRRAHAAPPQRRPRRSTARAHRSVARGRRPKATAARQDEDPEPPPDRPLCGCQCGLPVPKQRRGFATDECAARQRQRRRRRRSLQGAGGLAACEHCGEALAPKTGRGRPRKFCRGCVPAVRKERRCGVTAPTARPVLTSSSSCEPSRRTPATESAPAWGDACAGRREGPATGHACAGKNRSALGVAPEFVRPERAARPRSSSSKRRR